jgi:Tfp pilus assembly protein PilO
MKSNAPARNWLVVVVLAGLAAAYVAFVHVPGRKAMAETRREIDSKRQFVAGAERLGLAVAAVQSDLTKTAEYVGSVGGTLPPLGGEAKILGQIHALAGAAGVTIARFEPEAPVRKESVSQIPVVITVTGRFTQILDLVHRVEQLPVRIWVDQVKCARVGKGGDVEKVISAELNLVIFADNSEDSDYAKLDERSINGRTR